MAIALTPLVSPVTSTGTLLRPPQHLTPPALIRTQVYPVPAYPGPATIAATPLVRPTTSTGMRLLACVPFPSQPAPQHLTPPALVMAHVCWTPTAIPVTPLVRPETASGTVLLI